MVVKLDKWVNRIAVVTGANSGIGAAVTARLLKEGLQVVGLDLNIDELEGNVEKSNGKLHVVKTDITKEEEILRAFKYVKENLGPVQILINGAGILQTNTIMDGNTERWRKIFDTNVLGLCITTREAISNMKEHNVEDGHIIHISSISAHKVTHYPESNVYQASKHAVKALAESLRMELNIANSKIKISSISPGLVKTSILDNVTGYPDMYNCPFLQPDDVAEAITFILSTPPHVQIHDMIIKPIGEYE